jgi:glycosyltransferase involved in cell wall biosynthesis
LRLFPGVAPGKIRVFPDGVDVARWNSPQGAEAVRERLRSVGVRPPYFVYAGGLSRRKNVGRLLMAMTAFRKRHPDYRLVITGGEKRTLPEKGLQEALESEVKAGAVIRLGEVPQSELALLYREAAASIYPSLYEGFGLPPLEAQAAGCPVLCSSAASLPEVVGDSALLFDPREIASLIEAMETLSRGASRGEWVRKGSENAARKPWDSMALSLLSLADEIGRSSRQLQM